MAQFPHLRNAPITEAVIDFRVEPTADVAVQGLIGALASRANLGYFQKGFVIRSEFGFSLKAEAEPQVAHEGRTTTIGVRLHSPDEKYVAQLSVEGFTLSRLTPYESWNDLVQEARRLWNGYSECVGRLEITRIATRYINNLRLPLSAPLERFLNLSPSLPPGLPQALSGFLQRYVLLDTELEATVILTQALEGASQDKPLSVILDIDAFRASRYSGHEMTVWSSLDQLRSLKNRVFFGCLKEEGIQLFL